MAGDPLRDVHDPVRGQLHHVRLVVRIGLELDRHRRGNVVRHGNGQLALVQRRHRAAASAARRRHYAAHLRLEVVLVLVADGHVVVVVERVVVVVVLVVVVVHVRRRRGDGVDLDRRLV